MSSHRLSLEILDTSNENTLTIIDSSTYLTGIAPTCPELLITAPGFQYSASVPAANLQPGFNNTLTACSLEIQTKACDSVFEVIPDGIYAIRYSVSPNEYVKVEYNHLRLTQIYNRWQKALCDLDLSDCLPEKNKKDKFAKLQEVDMYLKAAKAKVEVCNSSKKGMDLYNYAIKLLDKIDCKTCG
jgi:hypothetical protein